VKKFWGSQSPLETNQASTLVIFMKQRNRENKRVNNYEYKLCNVRVERVF